MAHHPKPPEQRNAHPAALAEARELVDCLGDTYDTLAVLVEDPAAPPLRNLDRLGLVVFAFSPRPGRIPGDSYPEICGSLRQCPFAEAQCVQEASGASRRLYGRLGRWQGL
jgi:hypothetical protein